MKTFAITILLAAGATCCFGQKWEFGGVGGAGFFDRVNASSSIGSATAGFEPGAVVGAFLGQSISPRISGEVRYGYMQNNLRLKNGSTTATFSGNAHVVHYDILLHTNKKGSRAQGYVAIGGGLKVFRGTGKEAAFQPLYQVGFMTKTQQLKPMADFGAGIRFRLSERVYLRTEFRDYITAFPTEVIAPAPGAKFGSILHDIVPMIGLSYEF